MGAATPRSKHIPLLTLQSTYIHDSNGAIDQEEMKKCFYKLEVSFIDEEIRDLFEACDINEDMGITFNEFIVLICLVYLLKDDSND
ncbi:hypothetical protein GBA52_008050, partial [Prunus armeniaca]